MGKIGEEEKGNMRHVRQHVDFMLDAVHALARRATARSEAECPWTTLSHWLWACHLRALLMSECHWAGVDAEQSIPVTWRGASWGVLLVGWSVLMVTVGTGRALGTCWLAVGLVLLVCGGVWNWWLEWKGDIGGWGTGREAGVNCEASSAQRPAHPLGTQNSITPMGTLFAPVGHSGSG